MVLLFAPEPGAEKLCDAAGSQPFQHMRVVFLTLGAGGVAAGGHEALRGKAQQVQRVEHAVFVLLPVPDHALHAVVLQSRAGLVEKIVAFHHNFGVLVRQRSGHPVIGQHQQRAHFKTVAAGGEALAQEPRHGGNARRARAAEDAAAQDQLHRLVPIQLRLNLIQQAVHFVRLTFPAQIVQRVQQVVKKQHPQIGVAAKALAVLQRGFRAAEKGAAQELIPAMIFHHFIHGHGPAGQVHAPTLQLQRRVKAGVLRRILPKRPLQLTVAFRGPLGPCGVAAGRVHVHGQHGDIRERRRFPGLVLRIQPVHCRQIDQTFQNFVPGAAYRQHIIAHGASPFPTDA